VTLKIARILAIATFAVFWLLGSGQVIAQNAYITNQFANTVSVIDTARNTVTATIPVGTNPVGVAVSPNGSTVYVTNYVSNTVSVIDAATAMVSATIPVGSGPLGVAVHPDSGAVYVADSQSNDLSVIDPTTKVVIATIPVGTDPIGVGLPFQSSPRFAGTPGKADCHGQSVSALAKQFGGLNIAATELDYPSVSALQNAILGYCEG
jgi:YVTN family beta-propeller protein